MLDVVIPYRGAQCPVHRPPALRLLEARSRMRPAEPGAPPRTRPELQPGGAGRGADGTEAHQLLDARDPTTFIVAALVLASAVVLAAWIPARRASRLDPARVLREG